MNLLRFFERFPSEEACRLHFKEQREKEGMACKSCKCTDLNWLSSKEQWHCRECGFRTTLRSGTVMQDSKLPFLEWYGAMAMMSHTKKPISAHELRRQLGRKRYEPVWAMMNKIRTAMGQRDDRYGLAGVVEFDEAHFSVANKKVAKLKRGVGSQRKKHVAAMAETAILEDVESGIKSSQCRYFKLKVIEKSDSKTIDAVVKSNLAETTIVLSDKSNRYVNIADHVAGHVSYYSDKETTNTTLKWVHIAISNAKRTLLGIYHCIHGKNLQLYLDEFVYKLNRRYFGGRVFDRLIIALASSRCTQAD